VALGFNLEFDRAIEELNKSIEVLQKRIDNLKEKKESEGWFTAVNNIL
jgi:prefoldin subunit 5